MKTSLYIFYIFPLVFSVDVVSNMLFVLIYFFLTNSGSDTLPEPNKNTSIFLFFCANLRYYTLTCHTIRHYLTQLSHFEEGWKQIRQLRVQRRVNR